jgi:hypothetical protein
MALMALMAHSYRARSQPITSIQQAPQRNNGAHTSETTPTKTGTLAKLISINSRAGLWGRESMPFIGNFGPAHGFPALCPAKGTDAALPANIPKRLGRIT